MGFCAHTHTHTHAHAHAHTHHIHLPSPFYVPGYILYQFNEYINLLKLFLGTRVRDLPGAVAKRVGPLARYFSDIKYVSCHDNCHCYLKSSLVDTNRPYRHPLLNLACWGCKIHPWDIQGSWQESCMAPSPKSCMLGLQDTPMGHSRLMARVLHGTLS